MTEKSQYAISKAEIAAMIADQLSDLIKDVKDVISSENVELTRKMQIMWNAIYGNPELRQRGILEQIEQLTAIVDHLSDTQDQQLIIIQEIKRSQDDMRTAQDKIHSVQMSLLTKFDKLDRNTDKFNERLAFVGMAFTFFTIIGVIRDDNLRTFIFNFLSSFFGRIP